jgi:hypothetical protein
MVKHLHHIIPRHMGGTDNPSNLIELSVEQHAEAHRKLWETHGKWEDRLAWLGLMGLAPKAELAAEAVRQSNRTRNHPLKGKTFSAEYRAKLSRAKLGKKYGPRGPYNKTEKSMHRPNRGQPWSAARRAAQQNRVGA